MQSSTDYAGPSDRAVDGNRYTHYSAGHCTHTLPSFSPWWSVDLAEEVIVRVYKVWINACVFVSIHTDFYLNHSNH